MGPPPPRPSSIAHCRASPTGDPASPLDFYVETRTRGGTATGQRMTGKDQPALATHAGYPRLPKRHHATDPTNHKIPPTAS